jgi:hypothetical protein
MQGKRLDTKRAELIAELEATLAPDVAEQVETMKNQAHTRSPSILPTSKRMSSVVPAVELSAVELSNALVQPRTLAQPGIHREAHSADSVRTFDAIESIAGGAANRAAASAKSGADVEIEATPQSPDSMSARW